MDQAPVYTLQERNQRIFFQVVILIVLWLFLRYGLLYLLYETALVCLLSLYKFVYKLFFLRIHLILLLWMLFYLPYHRDAIKFRQTPPPKYKTCRPTTYQYGHLAVWKSYLFFFLMSVLFLQVLFVLFADQTPIDQAGFTLARVEQCKNI